ncbi:neighbor of COX4-like protein [Aphelenchoides avenae]|nr:neighbor of COX4-like protein [Aphelenchus avenae]
MVVEISSTAYSKVVLHAIKYPHCTVRGVLLGRKGSGGESDVRILDVIPALHNALLAPPVEMLFIHLDAYCQESKLDILGVYFGKDRLNDESLDDAWCRIAVDKLQTPQYCPIVLQIENHKLSLNAKHSCLQAYAFEGGKWKNRTSNVENLEETLNATSAAIQERVYRDLYDFENHLDDPNIADFYNTDFPQKLESLLQ